MCIVQLKVRVERVRDLRGGGMYVVPGEVRGAGRAGLDPERCAGGPEDDVSAAEEAADGC